MKIRPIGAELFHAESRTDRHDEAKVSVFEIFRTRLKIVCFVSMKLSGF